MDNPQTIEKERINVEPTFGSTKYTKILTTDDTEEIKSEETEVCYGKYSVLYLNKPAIIPARAALFPQNAQFPPARFQKN